MDFAVECRQVSVDYGPVRALDHIDLEVGAGETLALLGPSGSGKTTLLYAIAGFLGVTTGSLSIGGKTVSTPQSAVAPEKRHVGMVFQNYALWPHLTVLETVAYPLRSGGQPPGDSRAKAANLLGQVGIADLAHRKPAQISGGQQQRVGLARALARSAQVFLFDEPTAHLDASIREEVAREMISRQRETGAAAIYSTHDSGEALAVADRVAILREGKLVQVGTPLEVYEQPVDLWAARLTGPASEITATTGPAIVRPDWVDLGGDLQGLVTGVWFRGSHTDYRISTSVGVIDVRLPGPPQIEVGDHRGWTLRHPSLGQRK